LLSGVGSGVALAAGAALVARGFPRERARAAAFLIAGAVVVYFGSLSALEKGAFHRFIWERHRAVMTGILRVAPGVRAGTVIALVNVPKDDDPFGHNMWFDLAVRLIYPGIPVAGIYFYADESPSPGDNMTGFGGWWRWDGTGFPPALRESPVARTVVVEYGPRGRETLAPALPAFVCRAPCAVGSYDPASAITGPVSPRAARRYRLDTAP
jgi:hypothetical protein